MNSRKYLAVGVVILAIGSFIFANQRVRENLVITGTAVEGHRVYLRAADGHVLGTVREAKYGANDRFADEATLAGVISQQCTGKTECLITASNDLAGDPLPGVLKALRIRIEDGAPDPPTPPPAAAAAASTPTPPAPAAPAAESTGSPTVPTAFSSLSSMYASTLSTAQTYLGGSPPPTEARAAPEPVEINWGIVGTIIGVSGVLILVAIFYPRSNPVVTGAKRLKRI